MKPIVPPSNHSTSSQSRTTLMPTALTACLLYFPLAGSLSGANILLNPGFESGSAGDADDWGEIGNAGTTISARSSLDPNSGGFHAYMAFDNTGSAAGVAAFVEQNQGANTIDNTKTYDLTFFAKADSTDFDSMNMFAQIQWLDQDGSDGGGFKGETLQSLIGFGPGLNTTYQQFTLSDLAPAAGSDSFLVRFQVAAGAIPDIKNGFYVDDVSLTQIPEPSALSLAALGGLVAFRRRRP